MVAETPFAADIIHALDAAVLVSSRVSTGRDRSDRHSGTEADDPVELPALDELLGAPGRKAELAIRVQFPRAIQDEVMANVGSGAPARSPPVSLILYRSIAEGRDCVDSAIDDAVAPRVVAVEGEAPAEALLERQFQAVVVRVTGMLLVRDPPDRRVRAKLGAQFRDDLVVEFRREELEFAIPHITSRGDEVRRELALDVHGPLLAVCRPLAPVEGLAARSGPGR